MYGRQLGDVQQIRGKKGHVERNRSASRGPKGCPKFSNANDPAFNGGTQYQDGVGGVYVSFRCVTAQTISSSTCAAPHQCVTINLLALLMDLLPDQVKCAIRSIRRCQLHREISQAAALRQTNDNKHRANAGSTARADTFRALHFSIKRKNSASRELISNSRILKLTSIARFTKTAGKERR